MSKIYLSCNVTVYLVYFLYPLYTYQIRLLRIRLDIHLPEQTSGKSEDIQSDCSSVRRAAMNPPSRNYCNELLRLEKSLFSSSEEARNQLKESVYEEHGEAFRNIHNQIERSARMELDMGGHTALFHAVISNHVIKVAVLLRSGLDVGCQDNKGRNIIHMCTSADMVRLLVEYGVDIYQKSTSGDTALHNISHVGVAEELIRLGLSVTAKNNAQSTPLHHALDPNMARLFLKYGSDPNALNYYSYSPLHLVASRGIWEVVYFLLVAGCTVTARGGDGLSPVSCGRVTSY